MKLRWMALGLLVGMTACGVEGDAANGEMLYNANCVSCHGTDAMAGGDLIGSDITGLDQDTILDAMVVPPLGMPSYESLLTEDERLDISAYVVSL